MQHHRILFVCSGNICRSPMAAAYYQHLVAEHGLRGVFVESAGTLGIDGSPASAEASAVMEEIGIDLTTHRSRGLEPHDLSVSDMVIAMTRRHIEIMAEWPAGADRRFLIRAFENGPEAEDGAPDLEDPIGHGVEFYREVRGVITRCLDHLAERHRTEFASGR